jgi:hypothetical protein
MALKFAKLKETSGTTIHVNPSAVAYVHDQGHYTQIQFTSGQKVLVNGTLDDVVTAILNEAK